MSKKVVTLSIAFGIFLNLAWELSHSCLYSFAYGGDITFAKLLLSTVGDAIYITAIMLFIVPKLKNRAWFLIPIGIIFAVIVEIVMLDLGFWGYSESMPIVPLVNVGLSPAIQLGATSFLTYLVYKKLSDNK